MAFRENDEADDIEAAPRDNCHPRRKPRVDTSLAQIASASGYLNRIGAEIKGLRRARVESVGKDRYARHECVVEFSIAGEVRCSGEGSAKFRPTEIEQANIAAEFATVAFPASASAMVLSDDLRRKDPEMIFVFRSPETPDEITAVVERIDTGPGEKVYLSHVPYSDGVWRVGEPDGKFPLFNGEKIRAGRPVMLHEGPKSARGAERAANDPEHPFHDELSKFVHVGWHGGVHAAASTDFRALKVSPRVVIVPDNDAPGEESIAKIAERLPKECVVYTQRWSVDFPVGFDFGDKIEKIPENVVENGWKLADNQYFSMWATDLVDDPAKEGKMKAVLRANFRDQWAYIVKGDRFYLRSDSQRR